MNYTLYYPNYEYDVEQKYEDILAYEFVKAFNEDIGFFLTDEQKQFIKDFDYRWNKNEIHEYEYYTTRNYAFIDWLKAKYEDEAEEECGPKYEDADDWWDSLDYTTKEDIMEYYCDEY